MNPYLKNDRQVIELQNVRNNGAWKSDILVTHNIQQKSSFPIAKY